MWRARPSSKSIITPGAKRHYGGRVKNRTAAKAPQRRPMTKDAKLRLEARRAKPGAAEVVELQRLGIPLEHMPRNRLAAARLLRDLKRERGEL